MDAQTLRDGLLQLILLIISIGLHEFGHAWMADLRGDPLPRLQGRVTLNPFAHTDPIGTIALPAIMIFLSPGFGLIGWGKPVQISLPNPKTRRMDDIYITLAGPAMNLVLCFILAVIGGLGNFDPKTQEVVIRFLVNGIFLNAGLVVFNLIPIPPLDGSRLALRLGLYSEEIFLSLARWGFIVLIVLVNLPPFLRMMHAAILLLASPWLGLWDLLS
ncbi:MAG: site-2 protease family protein [Verrucomicrobia bacterium]|jgi:Zn-dependent protease|nr:site-2 protease family protein [Opitutales bacterium]NBV52558.1 site-2 protease family protein [Verrucomicrobiota bacterium]